MHLMFTIIVAPEHNFDIIDGPSEISVTIRDDMDCESQLWSYSALLCSSVIIVKYHEGKVPLMKGTI